MRVGLHHQINKLYQYTLQSTKTINRNNPAMAQIDAALRFEIILVGEPFYCFRIICFIKKISVPNRSQVIHRFSASILPVIFWRLTASISVNLINQLDNEWQKNILDSIRSLATLLALEALQIRELNTSIKNRKESKSKDCLLLLLRIWQPCILHWIISIATPLLVLLYSIIKLVIRLTVFVMSYEFCVLDTLINSEDEV